MGADDDSRKGNAKAEKKCADDGMTEHGARLNEVVCANEMRHLYRESHRSGTRDAAEKPRRRLNKTDAR